MADRGSRYELQMMDQASVRTHVVCNSAVLEVITMASVL